MGVHRKEVKIQKKVRCRGLYTILTKESRFGLQAIINLWESDR